MGFEQLAFSFAHLGLLTYIHCLPNGFGLFGFGSCSHRGVQPCFAFRLVVVVSHIFSPLVSSLVGGAVYANVI